MKQHNTSPRLSFFVVVLLVIPCNGVDAQCAFNEGNSIFYPGQSGEHQTGSQSGNAWVVTVADPKNEYLTYGPYAANMSSNPSRVDFLLSIDNNSNDDLEILIVDVNDAEVQQVLTQKSIYRTDFAVPNTPQIFSLFFSNQRCSKSIEFRVFYVCCAEVTHYQTAVRNLDDGMFGPFWNLEAHFQLVSETNLSVAGVFILPVDGVWYVFHREQSYEPTPSYCTSVIIPFRILVRTSTDQGLTYSDPIVVAQPIPNTPSECALVDGSPFYDNETNTWHYLSQCIARTGGWNLCHYYLQGTSPLAMFTANPQNPVVKGGQLFSQICAGTGKHCTETTVDEGTPDIVKKENGYFYVTFHGFDYKTNKGYRGAAQTPDFVNWSVDAYNMPDDAIFSSIDCQNWNIAWSPQNGGCIGGGEGTIMMSGDYYYQIIEAPDITLGCITTIGVQNWVLGIVRSPSLSPSGTWEEFNINPTVVPLIKAGCSLQYHRLFQDDSTGKIYLSYIIDNFETDVGLMKVNVLETGFDKLPIVATAP